MMQTTTTLFLLVSLPVALHAFVVPIGQSTQNVRGNSFLSSSNQQDHWQDFLLFDRKPTFDVIEKTKEYVSQPGFKSFKLADLSTDYFDERYVFRGPAVGPMNRKDLVETNTNFNLDVAFPDLNINSFGFCVDPENPYRVMFFERWTGTNTGTLSVVGINKPPNNKQFTQPAFPFSIVWTPEGKIIYEHLGPAVDRFEGNTKGDIAVFGLFATVGIPLPPPGILSIAQKVGRKLDDAIPIHTMSREENIPDWWKSESRGVEPTDM